MTFFGKKSDHLEQLEKAGHTLHEVNPIVWVPFAILAVATIAIGVVGFAFGAELQHILAGYLANYFGITEQKAASKEYDYSYCPATHADQANPRS